MFVMHHVVSSPVLRAPFFFFLFFLLLPLMTIGRKAGHYCNFKVLRSIDSIQAGRKNSFEIYWEFWVVFLLLFCIDLYYYYYYFIIIIIIILYIYLFIYLLLLFYFFWGVRVPNCKTKAWYAGSRNEFTSKIFDSDSVTKCREFLTCGSYQFNFNRSCTSIKRIFKQFFDDTVH